MANIDISSLFSDIVPDPERQQRERTLQQNDAVNQANLVGKLGGMAAYYAPERSRALQQSATGLLGIDTRTESQKAMEQLKDAKIDLSSREGLIKAANIYQNIDPIKAAQLRTQAAALKTEEDKVARAAVENQQTDTAFALNRASALETITSDVTAREERTQAREGYASLIDTSTVLSAAEKNAQKELIEQGAYDGKVDDVMRLADPKPITVGNRVLKRTVNGWEDIPASNVTVAQNGLRAIAQLRLGTDTPAYNAAIAAINEKSITNATQIEALAPTTVERGEISPTVQKFHGDAINSSMAAGSLINEVDALLNTIQSQNLLNYDTAGVAANVRTAARNAFGGRDEIEILRTGYTKVRDVAEATDTLADRGRVREALPDIAKGFEERGYNDIASQVGSGALSVADANKIADARTNIENTDEWARMNNTTIFRRSDGETISTGEIPPEMIMELGEGDNKRLVGINQDGSVGFNVSAASLLSGEDTASDAVPAANPYYNEVATSFNAINQNISTAEQLIADYPRSTGLGGNILQAVTANIPVAREIAMQPRIDLQNQIDSIISNIGFDRLQKMRDESKTGGALGNVSNIELGLLQATIASLKVEQDPELLLMNLQKVRQHYENLMKAEMGLSVEVDLTNPAYAGQVQQLDGVIYVKDPDSPTGWSKPKDANSLTIKKL